jgi:dihydropteroate synthase
LLIGISRKSFIGLILNKPVEERLIGTVTANTIAILNGADIVRVHDVEAAAQMAKIIRAIGEVK